METEKLRIHALNMCCSNLLSVLTDKSKDKRPFPDIFIEYEEELANYFYMTWLILKYSSLNFYTVTTHFQRLSITQKQTQAVERIN